MPRRFQDKSNLPFYVTIVLLDICAIVTFGIILLPAPVPSKIEPIIVQRAVKYRIARQGTPIHLTVPSVAIDIPVRTGHYISSNNTWSIDNQTAFYADQSVPVNDSNGATLIYGHDTSNIFASLITINHNAIANVYTDNGQIFHYKYRSSQQVLPSDTSVLDDSGPPTLVLQTCSGLYDMYRTLVVFSLLRISYVE